MQWRWLVLPYVLVLLGAVYVVAVIYHGLQDGETSSQLSKPSDMGREADETQARLLMSQSGLRLVQT